MRLLVAVLSIMQKLQTMEFLSNKLKPVLTHTGHFMVGLAWKSQRLIRCLLAVHGS